MADENYRVKFVVGIDLGTTYSGYVFSLSKDELHFYSPNFWSSGHGGMTSLKMPTSLLLNPDQTRHWFGFEAEDKYAELVTENEHRDYYLCQRFKMELHSKHIKEDSKIFDICGKPVPAMKVFSLSIEYLKEHCLKTINDRGFTPKREDIKFVLTVPAIWNDISKQFMRTAAIKAGIEKSQLTLALEPEAASIYCQRESLEKLRIGQQQSKLTKPKTRYLLADIGECSTCRHLKQ
uniref:Heat shock 70 kDa protein 12A-like isoform X2 n=1 Tax=Crassostrea virginica TaxID=6565 RepID=A0A8B8C379_CRAVI|nr:heat shock 70 kDa protein 12A-like isoform X2 [Crassostrea virginica]